jgi:hypothetical protein
MLNVGNVGQKSRKIKSLTYDSIILSIILPNAPPITKPNPTQ